MLLEQWIKFGVQHSGYHEKASVNFHYNFQKGSRNVSKEVLNFKRNLPGEEENEQL